MIVLTLFNLAEMLPDSMGYAAFLSSLFPSSHDTSAEVYSAMLGAVGYALDQYDPVANELASEFSATAAEGPALDRNGQDWGVYRRPGESDDSYQLRILSAVAIYTYGSSVPGMKAVVGAFTGTPPIILEQGPQAFRFSISAMGSAAFMPPGAPFTFEAYVQNPGGVAYNHLDMEDAVSAAKPARSTAIIYHNGTDASPASETATAIVTII